ncbi:MAG: hypothetical protein GXY58_06210 [Planctomycetaceae bacterium]|nr:hypothetical protein [Planctomycetaceae bacterium]
MSDVTVLARQLQDKQASVRAQAAERLGRCGDAACVAVELVRACGDEEEVVREWAVAALEELGPPPASSLEPLCSLAAAAQELVAYWAVTLLGRAGPEAFAAAPALVSVLETSPHPAVRQRAAWALGRIRDQSAATIAALERVKSSGDPRLARLAAESLDNDRTASDFHSRTHACG